MHKVFVYGTLRVGEGNYKRLLANKEGANYLGEDIIEDFTMVHLGGFPALVKNEDIGPNSLQLPVKGDVFEVDDEVMQNLDWLEGYPSFYDRMEVETADNGECWVYYHNDLDERTKKEYSESIIQSNDWLSI